MPDLQDTLDITEEQRQAMMPSWRQYRELIESLQQQAAEMRQVVSGSPTPTTDNGAPLTVKAPSVSAMRILNCYMIIVSVARRSS